MKNSIIINSILLVLIVYNYINKYFPSILNFSDTHYRSVGGDSLTKELFSELFLYACIIGFYTFNSVAITLSLKKKKKVLLHLISILLLVMVQITVNKIHQFNINKKQEERFVWVKKAKAVDYHSNKLKVEFSYTNIMPRNKKVTVQEKGNQIKIFTEGYENRADRVISIEKKSKQTLHEYLTKQNKDKKVYFDENPYHNNFNKKLQVVEMKSFTNRALKTFTGLSFKDLNILKYNEIEHVYFVSNNNYPSRFYAIILMTANERAAAKPRLESFDGANHTFYYISNEWYESFHIIEQKQNISALNFNLVI